MKAAYYTPEGNGLRCGLCPHRCLIRQGKAGLCRTRVNRDGQLEAENYGCCTAVALDPIEKKPLYHFYPGAEILSLGSWGCKFHCSFCQNWQLAQTVAESTPLSPEQAVRQAIAIGGRNIGIAYTYSEPGVWVEFVRDTAAVANSAGLKNVVVSNGFINRQPLAELLAYVDAMNIDVKAFTDDFYQTMCSGSLRQVKQTVEQAAGCCHIEVTTLLIPGLNDSEAEIRALARWLAALNPDIVLHLSRYYPQYRLALPPTPLASLQQAWQTAREYLRYVYIGNAGNVQVNTECPECGELIINRSARQSRLTRDKRCPACGHYIPIIGQTMF